MATHGQDSPRSIFAQLMFERPADRSTLDRHIVRWLEQGLDTLGADLREGIAARPPLRRVPRGGPVGDPLTPWGTLFMSSGHDSPRYRKSDQLFSERAWQKFLSNVLSPDVNLAVASLCRLDDRGGPTGHTIWIVYETVEADWIRLGAMFETSSLLDTEFVSRLKEFIRATASQCDPAFGLISHTYRRTRLEESLASVDVAHIPFMRQTLRAHGWLTLVPKEIGEKLGGSAGLTATTAFESVEELPDGGLLAWATNDFGTYDTARIARVEKVFAPHLLTKEVVQRHRSGPTSQ